jgi:uncharacterized protein (TIGR00290 family)
MDATPVLMSWSGGKDSALALARLRAEPRWRVAALLTSVTAGYDRISMHGVRRRVLDAQVAALGLPLRVMTMPPAGDNAAYEAAFAAALAEARVATPGLDRVAYGDLFLEDVRAYRERQLAALGWAPLFPIWGEDTARLARSFVAQGFRAVLTCVDTTQLDAGFVGREFDAALLAELPSGVDPCGERGEFHTLVYAGPGFAAPLRLARGETVLRDQRFAYCDFDLA